MQAAHQHDAARVPVSKQRDRLVRPLLQIAEADDVAKRLDGIEDAVGAGIRLDKPVHFEDTLGRKIRPFPVDIPHLFIIDLGLFLHRLDIIDAERQHVFIVDGIDDGIGMQLFPERLRRRAQRRALRNARIYGKDGRARKPE